jgi:hypothetical protein
MSICGGHEPGVAFSALPTPAGLVNLNIASEKPEVFHVEYAFPH